MSARSQCLRKRPESKKNANSRTQRSALRGLGQHALTSAATSHFSDGFRRQFLPTIMNCPLALIFSLPAASLEWMR